MESRILGDEYVRFGGRWAKTHRRKAEMGVAFSSLQNGDQDVKKTIMMTIGGCVAMVAMATALPMFFK